MTTYFPSKGHTKKEELKVDMVQRLQWSGLTYWQVRLRRTIQDSQEDDTGLSGATCNDDNLCTVDTYDSSQGVCVFTPVLCGEGEVCDPNDGECHMPPPPTSRITPGDAAANNGFGKSVAITQTPVDNIKTAIIGAPGKAPGEDAAYVFDLDSEERWVEVPNGKLNSSRQGRCGTSVAVFGNFYFVGCPSYGK